MMMVDGPRAWAPVVVSGYLLCGGRGLETPENSPDHGSWVGIALLWRDVLVSGSHYCCAARDARRAVCGVPSPLLRGHRWSTNFMFMFISSQV